MTIYFDEDKKAYSYEISNPIATVEDTIWNNFAGTDKWDIVNNEFIDISQTIEYQQKLAEQEVQIQKENLVKQIEDLDIKRIRAIAEPTLKNLESGQTWLAYYTEQIQILRSQILN